MNRCAYQNNAFGVRGEMKGQSTSVRGSVVCPKPRRLGLSNPSINDHIIPSRWHINHQSEICDSKAGKELLDLILTKGSYASEKPNIIHLASLPSPQPPAPPFFCGSPPSRASNPVIQDTQFGSNKLGPLEPAPILLPTPASSSRKGGACVPMKFGQKPAAVRIEGFDCLSCGRGNCSISAVA